MIRLRNDILISDLSIHQYRSGRYLEIISEGSSDHGLCPVPHDPTVLSSKYLAASSLSVGLLAIGCTGDIGDNDAMSSDETSGGTTTGGPGHVDDPTIGAVDACTGATLVPARVRKITDEQYARLVTELLPGVTPDKVATPGTELALIKDADEFVVRGPLASQYWDGALVGGQASGDQPRQVGAVLAVADRPGVATHLRTEVHRVVRAEGFPPTDGGRRHHAAPQGLR